jgi:hypothetical protein
MMRYDGELPIGDATVSVPAMGVTEVDICSLDHENAYGVVTVAPRMSDSVISHIIRIGAENQYRFPTSLRESSPPLR